MCLTPDLDLDSFDLDELLNWPVIPIPMTPGSETSITLLTPIFFISQPTSSEAPGPYFSGVVSIVKMVS
jgi:hypothetical protein